jgi:YVTN family beta-propeller protein
LKHRETEIKVLRYEDEERIMMNIKLQGILLEALALATMLLCFSMVRAEVLYVVNSQSRTLSRIDTATDAVNNSFAQLGNVPNKVIVDEEYLYVVNSGDNAVQKLNRNSGSTVQNIFIGLGVNPWDAVLYENYLYVTGLFSNKVYKIDLQSGTVVASVNVGIAPEGLHVLGNKLYVTNTGDYLQSYAGSSVSVIALDSFTVNASIPVSANPQYLASFAGKLHVSCTGNWADVAGAVCIIDPGTEEVIQTIPVGGTPGCLWIAREDLAYLGDSNGAVLYGYNPSTFELLHGDGNPLANGGSELVGTDEFIAVLSPNWGSNAEVKLLHPDLTPWKQYTVAMMPTDLKLHAQPSESSDLVGFPSRMNVYPNPLHPGEKLRFSSAESLQGELRLYNLKGQKLLEQPISGTDICLPDLRLPTGVYFYRIIDRGPCGSSITGKIMIQK